MKDTPFVAKHIDLKAKMAEFAGYNMPISYTGINDEHIAVRNGVGVFDVSHMGEFIIKGNGAKELVQKITSNDVAMLEPGKIQYSCLPNESGGIIDDLLVYQLEENNYMLVVNASNIMKDLEWIKSHNSNNVEIHDISDQTALLAVQGPKAVEALQSLTEIDLSGMAYYTFRKGAFAGIENVLISATGYTGSGGFEIYFGNGNGAHIWDSIFAAGKSFGIVPAGLGARDTLRLEMGFCLYGNDINDTTSPLEAGLGWITKFTDGNDFINRAELAKQKEEGISKKLVGFEMIDRGIPRHDYIITDSDKNQIGKVSSGTQSPSLGKAIGMGYVAMGYHTQGTEILINVRNKYLKARVVRPPFYKA